MVIECNTTGIGATVWQGTAFQCDDSNNNNNIALRHTLFRGSQKPEGICNNGAIIARAIGVFKNIYISQLSVTLNLEMNNTTVECVHDHYNLTESVVKTVNIMLVSYNQFPIDAQLNNVSRRQLTFKWNPKVEHCYSNSSAVQYFVKSTGCGSCPQETYNNFITCRNVRVNKLCSFTVGTNTTDGVWEETQLNVSLRGN